MKLGFALPIVGPAVSSAAGLSAFCRGLEDLGYAFAVFPSLDQMLDFASQVIARTGRL
jgi:hypothetical protein